MSTYVVLLPGDEAAWENATEEERAATYARHGEFARQLAERGHTVTAGAELQHSRTARTVRTDGITDGPYAETVEQLSGFFTVNCDDHDALVEAAQVLTRAHPVVEIRPVEE